MYYITDVRVHDFIINDSGTWIYYQRAYLMGSQILRLPILQTEFLYPDSPGVIVCFGEMIIHWDDAAAATADLPFPLLTILICR